MIAPRHTSLLTFVLLLPAAHHASAQPFELRMVIGTGVACRAEPRRTSAVARAAALGEVFAVAGVRSGSSADETWYGRQTGLSTCWVLGALTATLSGYDTPDPALLALADHALEPETKATFDHLVAADNLLDERRLRRTFRGAPPSMPVLLELRHLQIVQAAAGAAGDRWTVNTQPLRKAWLLGHADVVVEFEPGANYHVPAARFWDLFERHRIAPEAEDIAWVAATTPVYGDECYTDCVLSNLAETYMRYWREFPRGTHVAEAIAVAIRRTEYAARFCVLVATGDLTLDRNLGRLLADYRSSLDSVTAPGKSTLLARLSGIEQSCAEGSVASLADPRAIDGLVHALGAGFRVVPERLAAFGESAAPAVLELLTDPDANEDAAYQALVALRHMTETGVLSASMISMVRDAAERWLTTRQGSLLTLMSAIDLAAALDDAGLIRILDSLSRDRREVVARGVTSEAAIERVQQRAAAALGERDTR